MQGFGKAPPKPEAKDSHSFDTGTALPQRPNQQVFTENFFTATGFHAKAKAPETRTMYYKGIPFTVVQSGKIMLKPQNMSGPARTQVDS